MSRKIAIAAVLLLILIGCALWLRYGGVTHERIYDVVCSESDEIKDRIDDRFHALDQKLDRVESKLDRLDAKLDRLLDIANRPLPDGLKPAQ